MDPSRPPSIITVEVEDYYHVGSFHRNIRPRNWSRFEARIDRNVQKALSLFDEFDIKATFFVLGWVAEKFPEIVRRIVDRGHEVGSKGYHHCQTRLLSREGFREELRRGREVLERVCRVKILGYRTAHGWFRPNDIWKLDILAEEGYLYDSSVGLLFRDFSSEPWRQFIHRHKYHDKEIWEVPLSSWRVGGLAFPVSGGNYYRQLPHTILKHAVRRWHETIDHPFVMYFHIWELDPEQPKINSGSWLTGIRHYRNLDKMAWVLRDYFTHYAFTSVSECLGIDFNSADNRLEAEPGAPRLIIANRHRRHELGALWTDNAKTAAQFPDAHHSEAFPQRQQVTIVIPCYNEEENLRYLANTLEGVWQTHSADYEFHLVLVDDCSSDNTWRQLNEIFGHHDYCTLLKLKKNSGVAAAILAGIQKAQDEIVCSIDCDCTYDPHELAMMIPMLKENVTLVTASPYHPDGNVWNVPAWRLALSKVSSWLYRQVLAVKLHTYTSCFRVYRKSRVMQVRLKYGGFLGVAEIIGNLSLLGAKIVEYPTTLEVRILGQSKMKILRTIIGHLKLLSYFGLLRLFGSKKNHRQKVRTFDDVETNAANRMTSKQTKELL